MALIANALVSLLKAHAGVAALVGVRVHANHLPQSPTLPAVSYARVSGARSRSHSGSSNLASPRYQIDAWAKDYGQAQDLANEIRLALDNFSGDVAGVTIRGAFLETDQDLYDDGVQAHRVSMDFFIWHKE